MAETALVTGATGFVGSWVAQKLLQKGYKVRALVRESSNRANLEGLNIEYVTANYKDVESLKKAVSGVDYVYHVAGVTKAKTEMEYLEGNVRATENMLKATYEANPSVKRFLHVSSLAAVGPSPSADKPVDETTLGKPITMYGRTKNITEQACLRYIYSPTSEKPAKLSITIVRPPAVYGPRDQDILEFFKAVNKGILPIVGGKKLISLIHVSDLADGMIMAAEAEYTKDQPYQMSSSASSAALAQYTYFISSAKFYTWDEIGEAVKRALGKSAFKVTIPNGLVNLIATISEMTSKSGNTPPPLNKEKAKDIVQDYWICSAEKAKKELGFKEKLSLEQGIKETADWYKSKGWL
ncbi:MAG: NAD-dependent epimerase/dehydratase family protein [Chlorobiales bacterium]|jgi:dihydroflavonol-4-reductase|nr:NAD-dependent epimerase/dehydratase family protein [Chlorobiales bacterium]